jgi:uncharacterized protein (TIGR03067 family)
MKRKLLGMAALMCMLGWSSAATAWDRGEPTETGETTTAGDGLRGTWSLVGVELMGRKIDLPKMQMTITFDKGKAVMNDGTRREESTYKIDDSKTPKEIDIHGPKNQGNQTMKAIYKFESDTLKIAFSANGPGLPRPTAFDGKDAGVMVLKRTK